MKKFLSILLSCSLICGNVFATGTSKSENSTSKINKKLMYGLISGSTILGVTGVTLLSVLLKKNHDKKKEQQKQEEEARRREEEFKRREEEEARRREEEFKRREEEDLKRREEEEFRRREEEEFRRREEEEFKRRREEDLKRQQEIRIKKEKDDKRFLDSHRAAPTSREYRGHTIELEPHVILNCGEFKEYLSRFPNSPILFRGVSFETESEISKYMDEFKKYGSGVSSTAEARGGNCYGSDAPDGHATYFSGKIDMALYYATNRYSKKYGYIVLGSRLPPSGGWDKQYVRDIWTFFPKGNEAFVLCSDHFRLSRNINFINMWTYMADYGFKAPALSPASSCKEKSLTQIREIQIWLLNMGIVLEEKRKDNRLDKGKFIGIFNPEKAEMLLRELESTDSAA